MCLTPSLLEALGLLMSAFWFDAFEPLIPPGESEWVPNTRPLWSRLPDLIMIVIMIGLGCVKLHRSGMQR